MNSELDSRVLYCDANCVVVNKISGEACEGAGAGMGDLPGMLSAMYAEDHSLPAWPPVAVHRLDVPVSGCALFARNEKALRFLNEAFRTSAVQKTYWAIVEMPGANARFSENTAEWVELVHWMEFDSKRNKSIAHNEPGPNRKKAILRYRLVGKGRDYLFMEIELITGRHHQIRAQFERLGLHIKGDLKYSARRSERNGGIRLHARSLSFPNPAGDGARGDKRGAMRITVQADPPLRDNLWLAFEEGLHST